MGVAVEFQQASLGYLSVSGENATQQRHGEASSHLPVSPASPSSTTEREWTSTPRRQFVELGDGRRQQRYDPATRQETRDFLVPGDGYDRESRSQELPHHQPSVAPPLQVRRSTLTIWGRLTLSFMSPIALEAFGRCGTLMGLEIVGRVLS
nr:hypothetical protein Iba_chr11aCG12220 [Ipomoea batatas]